MDEAKVMEVLRHVEWLGGEGGEYLAHCPWCAHWESEGHADDCKLAALLDEATQEIEHKL